MASSSQDAHSQSKRPAAPVRQSSTSSYVSQSPSDGPPRPAPHKVQRQHVVGQSRMQRNTSLGKNLNKLNKGSQAAHAHGGDGNTGPRHHGRTHSGNSSSAPSSPRAGFKRNASSGAIVRTSTTTNAHPAPIRKNHSSGHLSRQGASKGVLKPSKSEIAPPKQALAQPPKGHERIQAPTVHPTVHFDIGNDEGGEDAWTEESASQSPTTTRSNTRSNSVVLDAPRTMNTSEAGPSREEPLQTRSGHPSYNPPAVVQSRTTEGSHSSRQVNGGSSHQHSRPPDADMITSRLLQRNAAPNPPPQMSEVAATVMSDAHHGRVLSHSQVSTLVDTPGRELVSRFMDGGSSAGTPRDSFLPARRNSPDNGGTSGFDRAKRNKSAPNVAERGMPSPARSHSRRSGTSTPSDLPPSRTQQKLMLQRASSNIEPTKLIPAILPRVGGPAFTASQIPYAASGEGRIDPRLQQQFNHVANEYRVVRRYRDPLADAIARLDIAPSTPRKARVPMAALPNGTMGGHSVTDLSASLHEAVVESEGPSGHRSRGSLESSRGAGDEGELEGRHSFESDHGGRMRNEAEEICRRLWESTETTEGD